MPLTSFIFGRVPREVSIADTLVVDAMTRVAPSRNATPSKFPVESGATISDHVQLDNLTLQLDGFISDAPLDSLRSLIGGFAAGRIGTEVGGLGTTVVGAAAGLFGQTQTGLEGSIKNRSTADTNFPKKALDYLLKTQEDRLPFKIVTSFRDYDNMVIKTLSADHTAQNGRGLRFSMTCEQIRIVETATQRLPESVIAANASASAASKVNAGKQPTVPASADTSENSTALFKIQKALRK